MSGAGKRQRNARNEFNKSSNDLLLITTVDDDIYAELSDLVGQRVVHAALWEDSLSDALAETIPDPAHQVLFDVDLYLEDGLYFELYGVTCFDDLDGEPWRGRAVAQAHLALLIGGQAHLVDVAVDEEDALVLVLARGDGTLTFLAVGAWLAEEWDELPEG